MDVGGMLVGLAGDFVRERVELVRREAVRPWRTGRKGTAAEVGRWIGVGLAVAALGSGVALAVLAGRAEERDAIRRGGRRS